MRVEEVDVGKELKSVDPNKELQYAELEHFQQNSEQKQMHNNNNVQTSLNHVIQDEPVSLSAPPIILLISWHSTWSLD